MMSFQDRVAAVCEHCADLVHQGAYAEALALAWLAITDADSQEYATASRKSLIVAERETRVAEMADREYASARELRQEFIDLVGIGDPCAILLVLDRILLTRAARGELGTSMPLAAYGGGLLEVRLDDTRLIAAGLGDAARHCYLLHRTIDGRLAKLETQHIHPFRHIPHWMVVRGRPDPASPSISARVQSANTSLDKSFESLSNAAVARIYLAEFIAPPKFVPKNPADKLRWVAVGLQNEEELREEAIQHLETALAEAADVVLFPELTITPRIKDEIARWLRRHNPFNVALERPQIVMVIAGSFHVLVEGPEYSNETWALDAQGNVIEPLTHRKICPVVLNMNDNVLVEDIREGNTISLLKTGGGVHALVICLDLAQKADTTLPLKKLPVNWLWVPSLSGKVQPHEDQAKLVTLSHFSVVACANQGPAFFYPDLPVANSGRQMQSFVISTRDGANQKYQEGPNWKIAVTDMRADTESGASQ